MDSLNLCWRGQPRSGKRTALHAALRSLAASRGVPFTLTTKQFSTGSLKNDTTQISTTAEEDGGEDGGSEKDSFPYEFSLVHIGFDIARMSMQDKIYLKPIVQRWGTGSQVLTGTQDHASRILVFYHAHLFSTESYFLLHSLLEHNFGDVSVWMTSELPVAERLSDYFLEIPVAYKPIFVSEPTWAAFFRKCLLTWSQRPKPKISETTELRSLLYELLMRNLRWTDCLHYLLDVIPDIPLSPEKQKAVLRILAEQEASGAGQTIPSYRIPLLWEALFLQIRDAVSQETLDGGPSSGSETPGRTSTSAVRSTSTKVGSRQTKSRGLSSVQA